MSALTSNEVAQLLKVHPETLARELPSLYSKGFPKPRMVGKRRRWLEQAVLDWLAGGRAPRARSHDEKALDEAIRGL